MAAMFQAQTANWEETQEKMSQLVPRNRGFLFCNRSVYLMNMTFFVRLFSAVRIYNNPRGTGFNRGGKPPQHQQQHQQQPDRPLPPSYVCYRCGQKGLLNDEFHLGQQFSTYVLLRSLDSGLPNKQ